MMAMTMQENNIVQNFLRIPLIEIEQLDPKVQELQGAMKVKYRTKRGAMIDIEDEPSEYEYEWVGGAIEFVPNPYPRVPMGTGKVAWLPDDAEDPSGSAITLPENTKSGERYGWNRELLASHYGEGYWKIVDPRIDEEIRKRYRNILANTLEDSTIKEQEIERKLADAQAAQQGIARHCVTVTRMSMPGGSREVVMKKETATEDIDQHPVVQAVRKENEELKKLVQAMIDANKPVSKAEKRRCTVTKKDGTKCVAYATTDSDMCVFHGRLVNREAPVEAPVDGNLGAE
jgi:Skp family chaperone for outer membrane proteins